MRTKMQSKRSFRSWPLVATSLLLLEPAAWAYSDPGSGALLLQALLAGFFGLCFYARRIGQRIGLLKSRKEESAESGPGE